MARYRRGKSSTYKPTRGHFAGRRFGSKQEYRDALARSKGYRNYSAQRRSYKSFNTLEALRRLTPMARQKRTDVLEVLNIMRRSGRGIGAGVRQFNETNPDRRISARTVRKYAQPALRQAKKEWRAKPYDRLLRIVRFPTKDGVIDIEVRDSRSASLVGEYWNAVRKYEATGDAKDLRRFRGRTIRSGKMTRPFLIRADALDDLANAGEFSLETIYEDGGLT